MTENLISIKQIPELLETNVRIKDIKEVESKISKLVAGGKDHLQIISDFDRTLSRHHYEGKTTKSSYCVFESIPYLNQEFLANTRSLYAKFRVIEDNPNMTVAEKLPHMEEWWEVNNKLFINIPYDVEAMDKAVVDSKVMLREGVDEGMKFLKDHEIPLLVFSAGLGDIVTCIIKHYNLMFDNVHVISNFFDHKDGIITGFKGKTIHVFNKNQHAVENCDYFEELSHRENIILMGDSLGDANMNEGVPGNGTCLKIGFLSVNIEEYLPQYLDHFDIVLLDDSSVNVFNALTRLIVNQK